eukprot:TRINITY_DN16137_c0_g1_i1.p3 TRINITY_DN16137_c0_g1~~TRINITY_DN16137_c0_g1_i1.p3  ORF type:complete len:140 (+),score=5.77 TRINITY_DN16137_c0_g1_i1:633-1052(+)
MRDVCLRLEQNAFWHLCVCHRLWVVTQIPLEPAWLSICPAVRRSQTKKNTKKKKKMKKKNETLMKNAFWHLCVCHRLWVVTQIPLEPAWLSICPAVRRSQTKKNTKKKKKMKKKNETLMKNANFLSRFVTYVAQISAEE